MTQAKIEPGETDISLAGRQKPRDGIQDKARKDLHPGSDSRQSGKEKSGQPKAGPLDRGIDLGN